MGRNGIVDGLGRRPLTEQEVIDLDHVLSTEAGRRCVRRLMYELGKMRVVQFAAAVKSGDAMAQHNAFALGYQAMATDLDEEIHEYLPKRYRQLFNEQMDAEDLARMAAEREQQTHAADSEESDDVSP